MSSFGISGTNAHMIIEQAPAPRPRRNAARGRRGPVVAVRAHPDALRAQAAACWRSTGRTRLTTALSLATSRAALEHRAVVVGGTSRSCRRACARWPTGEPRPSRRLVRGDAGGGWRSCSPARAASGPAWAVRLYASTRCSPTPWTRCGDRPAPGPSAEGLCARTRSCCDQTAYTQAALFAVEVALFRLVESLGVRPDFLAGSLDRRARGGARRRVLSLEDACALVAARGRLIRRVDLPTYAFRTERFWPRLRPERTDQLELCYEVAWTSLSGGERATGRWLLLGSADEALTAGLAARGLDVTDDIAAGEIDGVLYTPEDAADVPRVLRELDAAGVDAPLWCLTRSAVSVAGSDAPAEPGQAAIWGLGRVAALEAEALGRSGRPARHAGRPRARPSRHRDRRHRGPGRHPRLGTPRPAHHPRRPERPRVDAGRHRADHRRHRRPRRVRRAVARRQRCRAPGAGQPARARRRRRRRAAAELAELGAQVTVAACDVADRAAVEALIADVHRGRRADPRRRPRRGRRHPRRPSPSWTLGGLRRGPWRPSRRRRAPRRAAVGELDAFVLFSSVAAAWGSGGQAAYAAANAYLDALAEAPPGARRRRDLGRLGPVGRGGMATREGDGTPRSPARPDPADRAEQAARRAGVPR